MVGGELVRLARRRRREADSPDGVLDTAEQAIVVAGEAARDTVNVATEGYEAAPRSETVLFNILSGFLGGFALIRLSTYGIRRGWYPFGSVSVGGRHVHHFVPGILIAFVAGGAGLVTQSHRLEETLAFPFGAGIGLTFDEAALLLELEDVYWTREGLLSVQLSLGMAGAARRDDPRPADAAPRRAALRGARADPRPRLRAALALGVTRAQRGTR